MNKVEAFRVKYAEIFKALREAHPGVKNIKLQQRIAADRTRRILGN